jgi:hypothetical protein
LRLFDGRFVVDVAADHERRENRIGANGRHDVPIAGGEVSVENDRRSVAVPVQRERLEYSSQCPPRSVHVGRTGHEPGERLADRPERGERLCLRVPKRRLAPRSLGLAVQLLECDGSVWGA